jgi:steroid 5-alpha reductase family enzyme
MKWMDWRVFFVTAILLAIADVAVFWLGLPQRNDWMHYIVWAVNLPAMPFAFLLARYASPGHEYAANLVLGTFAVLVWATLLGLLSAWRHRRKVNDDDDDEDQQAEA